MCNPQQDANELNPAMYEKDYMSWQSVIFFPQECKIDLTSANQSCDIPY